MMMKRYIYLFILFVCFGSGLVIQSCDTLEAEAFGNENALYFERSVYNRAENVHVRVDTAKLSITHYPGMEQIEHPFRILLIGDTLPEAREYKLEVVDSLTNIEDGIVTLPEKLLFEKGVVTDSLWITIHATKIPKDKEFYITFRLVANENFGVGYKGYTDVKLWVNNKQSQPSWWDSSIEKVFLGPWSPEKFEALVIATKGINSFEGLSATMKRVYALQLKDYIAKEGITEADGKPMVIPIY